MSASLFINRKLGFSLVGVLIAATLMGFIAVGISKLLSGANTFQRGIERNTEFSTLISTINMILSRPELCTRAFRNASSAEIRWSSGPYTDLEYTPSSAENLPLGILIHRLYFGGNSRLASHDSTHPGGLRIAGMGLVPVDPPLVDEIDFVLPGDDAPTLLNRTYASFYIRGMAPQDGAGAPPSRFERFIPMEVLYDMDGNIRYCTTEGTQEFSTQEDQCDRGQFAVGWGSDGILCDFFMVQAAQAGIC